MVSVGCKNSDIMQLKQIINSHRGEETQLQLLKEFETSKSLKECKILSSICELVPLTSSIGLIKDIISLFFRRLVVLLEEGNVLQNAELSKKCLECLKQFWSLCSRQQNVISSSQWYGNWHPTLLEEITPLASMFIDLFISAYEHKEDQVLWSRRLYSWLNFDLPDRAIKIALLEAEAHRRDGAKLAAPIVSRILQRKFDVSSNPDYLLHFLLLKKWQGLVASLSNITEMSKYLKAPASFLSWLQRYWRDSNGYIPEDTSLEGAAVSQWLLKLNTSRVLESLTDALQMAVFPENVESQPGGGDVSGSLLFVVDKKGHEHRNEIKKNKGELSTNDSEQTGDEGDDVDKSIVEPGHKRKASKASESPSPKKSSSPKKKRMRTGVEDPQEDKIEGVGFCLDIGSDTKSVDCSDESHEKESTKLRRKKRTSSLNNIDEGEDKDDEENLMAKRQQQNSDTGKDRSEGVGFFLDRGSRISIKDVNRDEESVSVFQAHVQTLSENEDKEVIKPGKRKRRSLRKDADNDDNEEEENKGDKGNLKAKRPKQSADDSCDENEDTEDTDSDVRKHTLRPRNLATAVLKKKNILIADPVSHSYFANDKASNNGMLDEKIEIFQSSEVTTNTAADEDAKGKRKKTCDTSLVSASPVRSSPRIRSQNSQRKAGTSNSPLIQKTPSTPQEKLITTGNESPQLRVRIERVKSQESPLNRRGNESPLSKKAGSTPQRK